MIFKKNSFFSYDDIRPFKKEFDEKRINENTKRSEILAFVLLILDVLLLLIDLLIYKPMRVETPAYLYLYYSHVLVFILLSGLLLSANFYKKRNSRLYKTFFIYTLIGITISWCVFMGINSISFTKGISAYIICMFCFAACFSITPIEALFTYSVSFIVLLYGLINMAQTPAVLYSNLVNVVITIILAAITSILNYSTYCKDFLNKKQILESNQMLEIANQKLSEYEKARTDFFANISHELRTPLNVIYSAEQMLDHNLKNNDFDTKQISKYIKMIKQNTYRLLRLINNLIDITKIDSASFQMKLTNWDIVKIVEDISLSVASFIEHNRITLTFDTEIEEKIIACNPDNVERIMLNLLSNAVKYGNTNGSIYVNIFLEPSYVCLSVKDTGIGIPEHMCDLIFDRFIQVDNSLKRTSEGSGIGLALVKSLVEMQGGHISVKSKYGEGSEFIIRFLDRILSESSEAVITSQLEERLTNKINIEFSDIYL